VALITYIACDNNSPHKHSDRAATRFSTPQGIQLLHFAPTNASNAQVQRHAEKLLEADKGGQIVLSDNRAGLAVPPGALPKDVLITIDTSPANVMEIECGPDGIQFNAPVDLTISYAGIDLAGTDERSLVVLWLNPEANRWEAQEGTVDMVDRTVTASLSHFSRYSLGGDESAEASTGINLDRPMGQQEDESSMPSTALNRLVQTMVQNLQDINPDIYRTVELELEDQRLNKKGDEVVLRGLVKNIDIYVYAKKWDALQSQKKVDLINETFYFLKKRYPKITPFISLKFDDKRQDLNLKSLLEE
jgi:hypothetical protein